MKLFKSLLVAPATLGLLAPMSATANEVTINDFNPAEEIAVTNSRVDGLEARINNFEAGSFSETTSASFSAEGILGGISTDLAASEAVSFDYQYQIGLTSSFTGEDSLDVTIDAGSTTGTATEGLFGMDATGGFLQVDGITYTFPVGSATMLVGDSTDISALYTGACAYSGFIDYITDCGTGNSVGVGGQGATVAAAYAFDGGFSLAGGVSSPQDEILGEQADIFGLEAAYTGDDYGVSVAFSDAETATFIGLNGYYTFDFATLSGGYETSDIDDVDDDTSSFFVGLTKEVGPGTFELGYTSTDMDPFLAQGVDDTTYLYEASYAYPVNDALTITPGLAIIDVDAGETTVAAVKASFAF
jgi:hypothetical protein